MTEREWKEYDNAATKVSKWKHFTAAGKARCYPTVIPGRTSFGTESDQEGMENAENRSAKQKSIGCAYRIGI